MEALRIETVDLSEAPYPGLRPFRSSEADIFFGRERQTDELLTRLGDHRFLAVVGPSGCGKSSLVAAGLMPALATGFVVKAGAHWRIASLRPGERPLHNLAHALRTAGILDRERARQSDTQVLLESAVRRGPLSLVEIVRGSSLERDANLLVFVDQFEELFRFGAGERRDEAEAFVALLLASAAAEGERIYVAVTMRSDFLGDCAPFHGLPEAINDGLYLTPRLTRDECAACITGPARVFDADLDPALVNRLLNDFGPDPDQLPLLQHALLRMWNRHDGDPPDVPKLLALADYEAIGGLSRSLSDHANEAYDELGTDHQRVASVMFRRLSDSETAGRDRRAPAHVHEIAELADVSVDDVCRVADVFRRRNRCFLMPREDVPLTRDTILDVSHESLLRQWDRAARWIKDEADSIALYRRLKSSAREWQRGEALLGPASLERALGWRAHATAIWARRYGSDEDFALISDYIAASEQDREAKRIEQTKVRAVRLRRSIASVALGVLAIAGALAWLVRPLLYVWEHTAYYDTCASRYDAPRCTRKLTRDQVQHRPISLRVVTAGLLGPVKRAEAINGREQIVDLDPQYAGADRGRHLATARWVYAYDADGQIASEHQYTRRGELVQGKIYVPRKTSAERLAVFIGAEGTPTPVRGRSENSSYYWAEQLRQVERDGHVEETISYLGASGEAVPGADHAFATRSTYDDAGNLIATTSLDAAGHPMNDTAGNATMIVKRDADGNPIESIALDKEGHRTRVGSGWTIRRDAFDAYGNEIEESYFDENEQPLVGESGWHRITSARDDHGELIEVRYFGPDGKPTPTTDSACRGGKLQHDTAGRLTAWTCSDAAGAPMTSSKGVVTWTRRYDDDGRLIESTALGSDGRPTSEDDAYTTTLFGHDAQGRTTSIDYRDADGKQLNNRSGYARSVTTYDDANRTEWTHFFGNEGEPVVIDTGYASVKRRRDVRWNVIEEHYYDLHNEPVLTKNGYAGWRATVDARGQETEIVYLGKASEVVPSKDGYAYIRSEYDDLGRQTAVRYLGTTRKPATAIATGVAGRNSSYDDWGRQIERTYVGVNGEPTHTFQGEAGWRAAYDRWGHQTRLQYLDTRSVPTLRAWDDESSFTGQGYAAVTRAYDARGNLVQENYLGVRDERVARPSSWSYVRYEYDGLDRVVRTSHFDAREKPVLFHGYHAVTLGRDGHGNAVDIRYFDLDGKTPILSFQKFAHMVKAFDRHQHVIEETVFGTHEERVTASDGAHRTVTTWDQHGHKTRIEDWGPGDPRNKLRTVEYRHDSWGNPVEERHLDPDGQPMVTSDQRCATLAWRYSDRQELLEQTCLGVHGAPVPGMTNGEASVQYTYDQPGERVQLMYYDEQGHPFITAQGYAGMKFKHDSLGREIEVTYLDTYGNQVDTTLGQARRTLTYDARGDLVERAYFQANDSPTVPVAKVQTEYNALRRQIKERYLGPGGKPARLNGRGQHITLYEYDDYGNVRALRYLDERGQPTQGYARGFDGTWQLCRRWIADYGPDGNQQGNGRCEQHALVDDHSAR
jgi:hypothetical protein